MCNWNNHKFFWVGDEKIEMGYRFCLAFVRKNIDTLYSVFFDLLRPMMAIDEFVYIMTNKRLIKKKDTRK